MGNENKAQRFYVLRVLKSSVRDNVGNFVKRGSSTDGSGSYVSTVDRATQFATVQEALGLIALRNGAQLMNVKGDGFEIVRVDRITIPGKITRRVLKDGEVIPQGAKWALMNPYSQVTDTKPSFIAPHGANHEYDNLTTTPLFNTSNDLVKFVMKGIGSSGGQIVRVVEEATQDTVSDTRTVLE